jgi:dinuclear metal center YbgI/SA1388 family protein
MKFKELINYLDEQFPKTLSFPGDNDGVDVCVDYDLEIGRTLLVLDVTFDAINYAITHGYNCILSHHTMLYQPMKKLDLSNVAIKKAVMLARHNMCVASFHTRLDSVNGGVNDCLLKALNINNNVELLIDTENNNVPIGRIVELNDEMSLNDFISDIKKALKKYYKKEFSSDMEIHINCIKGSGNVKRIGVVSGGGMDFANLAVKMGADTFFTGEGKYPNILELSESYSINIITAGHFETEAVVLPFIKSKINERFPDVKVDCFIGENTDI